MPTATTRNLRPIEHARRRNERLQEYLSRRSRLAARWARAASHGLADSGAVLKELLIVEQAIQHCWPETWEVQWTDWNVIDASYIHSEDVPDPTCEIRTGRTEPPLLAA